ncbi:MAG: DUF5979 domain-containing protein [Lachnospiraceae bacterium]|nr:DUF5979 domain-containing protein [Lachnospiraceae bacterium]
MKKFRRWISLFLIVCLIAGVYGTPGTAMASNAGSVGIDAAEPSEDTAELEAVEEELATALDDQVDDDSSGKGAGGDDVTQKTVDMGEVGGVDFPDDPYMADEYEELYDPYGDIYLEEEEWYEDNAEECTLTVEAARVSAFEQWFDGEEIPGFPTKQMLWTMGLWRQLFDGEAEASSLYEEEPLKVEITGILPESVIAYATYVNFMPSRDNQLERPLCAVDIDLIDLNTGGTYVPEYDLKVTLYGGAVGEALYAGEPLLIYAQVQDDSADGSATPVSVYSSYNSEVGPSVYEAGTGDGPIYALLDGGIVETTVDDTASFVAAGMPLRLLVSAQQTDVQLENEEASANEADAEIPSVASDDHNSGREAVVGDPEETPEGSPEETPSVTAPAPIDNLTYNGSAQDLVEAGSAEFGTMLYSLDGEDYSEDIPTATDAGEYAVYYKVEGGDGQEDFGPETVNVVISPLAIRATVTGNTDTATYDGARHDVSGYTITADSDLYDLLRDYTFSGDAEAFATNAGTVAMGLAPAQFENINDNFKVTFRVTDGWQKIDPLSGVVVTVTGNNVTEPYDGTEHEAEGYAVSINNALYQETDFVFSGLAEASRTNAGTTNMNLRANQFENNNANFEDVTFAVTDGYVTVEPININVTIIGNTDVVDYDGAAHSVGGYTAEADNPLYDVNSDFTFSGQEEVSRTDAGTTNLGLAADQFENTDTNFGTVTFAVTDGYITVSPIEATVSIIGHHAVSPYDGEEHAVSGYDVELEEDSLYQASYISFNGSDEARRTAAGTTYMGLSAARFSNTSENFSTVTFEVEDGYQEITPIDATVTITGHTGTFAYDGQEHVVEGYDVAASTPLYTSSDFAFLGTDTINRTAAGITEMRLSEELFRNVSPNFANVTFEVTDGWIQVDPVVIISKTLDNELATTPETFRFDLILKDENNQPLADWTMAEGVTTDAEGKAEITLSVAGGNTATKRLLVPLESSLIIEEDKASDTNNYKTTITVDGNTLDEAEYELDQISQNETVVAFTNAKTAICRVDEEEFQTISSAAAYINAHGKEGTIEMLVDYVMPQEDNVVIPANCTVTLVTAPEFEGTGAAKVMRASGHTGAMFTNHGVLNIGNEEPGSGIILDGNKDNVTAQSSMIANIGTLIIYEGGVLRNAATDGNGGAVSGNGELNLIGGEIRDNAAANGGAVYTESGVVNVSGGSMSGNTASANGGAICAASGSVVVSGGSLYGNSAANGGAVYAGSGTVSISAGSMTGNTASTNGGAVYAGSGGVTVTGGTIGGLLSGSANTAMNGSAIFVHVGSASFSGGSVTGNTALLGGAVGVGSDSARLFFSEHAKVTGNAMDGAASNVYLDVDTDLVINSLGLESDANVGIYVPGDGDLYRNRGVSGARFGGYTANAGLSGFKNDRTIGMTVSEDNYKMKWGRTIRVEMRELGTFSTNLPPANVGTFRHAGDFYPTANENYMDDIAASVIQDLGAVSKGYQYACAFGKGATSYSECLTMLNWNSATGDWGFVDRDGQFVTYDSDPPTLVIYYALPVYLSFTNNTSFPMSLVGLKMNSIDVAANHYGLVIARNSATEANFAPIEDSDLTLDPGQSINLMFPGVRNKSYSFDGLFAGADETLESVLYSRTEDSGDHIATRAADGGRAITMSGNTRNDASSLNIVFGGAANICKIVDRSGEEHFYPSLYLAVTDGDSHYDDWKTEDTDTIVIEMIRDYLIPSTDLPDIPSGKKFALTTAASGTAYDGAGPELNGVRCAVISQDQGNINSFITSKTGGAGTSLTVSNLVFEGKQLDAVSTNGGVINTRDCEVLAYNVNFTNFSAGNGGAIFAQFGTALKSAYEEANNHVRIENSVFENCASKATQDKFGGGAIWSNAKALELVDCDFSNCTATQQGGAVYHRIDDNYSYTPASTTYLSGCTFEHCWANAAGGLEINAYTIEIHDCTFDDCQAKTRNGGGFNAYLRDAKAVGTSLTITDSTFNNCFATQDGGVFRTMMNTTVTNCTFTNNTANGNGGGIAQNNGNILILDHCTVTGNKSGKQGGGIYSNGDLTLRNNCEIMGNSLTTNNVNNGAGVYLISVYNEIRKTLTLGDASRTTPDTCIISGNVTADGSASNLRLPESGGKNTDSVIVLCDFTTGEDGDKLIHVLNANAAGTLFGSTGTGLAKPAGFTELEHIFVADNNDLYGIYNRDGGNKLVWRGDVICKITDGNGHLLYFNSACTDPAVFDNLDDGTENVHTGSAFAALRYGKTDLPMWYKDDNGVIRQYDDASRTYSVEMLVEDFTLDRRIVTNKGNLSWQTIVLTTAGENDALYPYRGTEGTCATLRRGTKVGNNNLMNVYVNMTMRNITVDGGSEDGIAAASNMRIVNMNPPDGRATTAMLTLEEGAVLQNAHTTGNGAGVLLNWGAILTMDGGKIINCAAGGNGGAVYKDGGASRFILISGEISGCSAANGGGLYIVKHNSDIKSEMRGGTITGCTAKNGGAVYLNNADNSYFYMSGGSITGNTATNTGGGIAVGGTKTKVYFSGDAYVYGNTKGADNIKCNVELNQNRGDIIQTTGLGEDALIGIYVPDQYMKNRGEGDCIFGHLEDSDANLFLFVNDRNDLRGARRSKDGKDIWWQLMHSLIVTNTVESDNPADKNVEFDFTVTLMDADTDVPVDITATFGTGRTKMEFVNGVAAFKLKSGESKQALYVPGTLSAQVANCKYEVTEAENPGFTTTVNHEEEWTKIGSLNEMEGDIPVIVHTAAYVNTRKTGDLTVSKTLVSDEEADLTKDFSFRVLLSALLSGTYGGMEFVDGVATFNLTGGQSVTATGLPTGITYTVLEAADGSFVTTAAVNGEEASVVDVPLVAGSNRDEDDTNDNVVVVINTRKVGGLKVTNTVVSDASADANVPFTFTVTLSDKTLNGTYDKSVAEGERAMTFENGVARFTLKNGESVIAGGLPSGITYTVTEAVPAGFTNSRKTNTSGRISDTFITSAFTNTRKTGKLVVRKIIETDRYSDKNLKFDFRVTLGNTVHDEATDEDVFVPDTTINKTYGSIEFTNGVGIVTTSGHKVETAEGVADPGVFMHVMTGNKAVSGLPQGIEYRIEEVDVEGFELTEASGAVGTLTGATHTAVFTNTRKAGNLTVSKEVVSDLSTDAEALFNFTVKTGDTRINKAYHAVDGNGDAVPDVTFTNGAATVSLKKDESITIIDLPTDVKYNVLEASCTLPGTADAVSIANSPYTSHTVGKSGVISEDGKTVVYRNTRKTGNLTVTKAIKSDLASDGDQEFAFTVTLTDATIGDTEAYPEGKTYGTGETAMTFANGVATFTLKAGESKTAAGLPVGVGYSVEEAADEDFATTHTGANGTISQNASTAAFTNTRKSGRLVISKAVESDLAADRTQTYYSFTVRLGQVDDEGEFVVDTSLSKKYGSVTFTEGVANTVRLQGGKSITISGLPQGIAYEVSEAAKADMTTAVADAADDDVTEVVTDEDGAVVSTYARGVVTSAADSKAAFTNTRLKGDLKISKTVVSDLAADAGQAFAFTVKLGDTKINKTYRAFMATDGGEEVEIPDGVTFAGGMAGISLTGGQAVTIKDLPRTVTYTLVEAENADFNTRLVDAGGTDRNSSSASGAVGETESAVSFINTRKTGDLAVTKRVVSDLDADKDAKFAFTVRLGARNDDGKFVVDETIGNTEENPDGTAYGAMTFKNGVATFELKKGETVIARGLPTGIGFTVTETADDGFTTRILDGDDEDVTRKELDEDEKVISSYANGQISEDRSTFVFTNTRKLGTLRVSKTVESEIAADKDAEFKFNFKVRVGSRNEDGEFVLDETFGNTEEHPEGVVYGDMTFKNGVARFALADGEVMQAAGMPIDAVYVVEENIEEEEEEIEKIDGFVPVDEQTGTIMNGVSLAEFTNIRAVCKITGTVTGEDGQAQEGILLYYKEGEDAEGGEDDGDGGEKVVRPAVFGSLAEAFDMLSKELFADEDGETAYDPSLGYAVKMLVPHHLVSQGLALPENLHVTLTTAGVDEKDGFAYIGDDGTAAVVKRGGEFGSMISYQGEDDAPGELTLGDITLDGNMDSYTANEIGGLVQVSPAKTLVIGTGTTLRNSLSLENGAGIYLAEGATLRISGEPSFGDGNFKEGFDDEFLAKLEEMGKSVSDVLNGGEEYARPRQDIFLMETGEKPASIIVTDDLTGEAGSIWVWADDKEHYYMLKPFAKVAEERMASLGEDDDALDEASYKVFRNARPDMETDCGGDYLTGQKGDEKNLLYWTGGFDFTFLKIDGEGKGLSGAAFALYTEYESSTVNTPYTKNDKEVVAVSASGQATGENALTCKDDEGNDAAYPIGTVLFEKIAPKTYYMVETTAPDGYEKNDTVYEVVIANDGKPTIRTKEDKDAAEYTVEQYKVKKEDEDDSEDSGESGADASGDSEDSDEIEWQYQIMNASKVGRKVILRKVNKSYRSLTKAQFRIFRYDLTEVTQGRAADAEYYESGDGGAYFIGDLPIGTYYLWETEAPEATTAKKADGTTVTTAYGGNAGKVFILKVGTDGVSQKELGKVDTNGTLLVDEEDTVKQFAGEDALKDFREWMQLHPAEAEEDEADD